jgi:hypothetical protein
MYRPVQLKMAGSESRVCPLETISVQAGCFDLLGGRNG